MAGESGETFKGRLRRWLPRITVVGGLLTLAVCYPESDASRSEDEPAASIELVDLGPIEDGLGPVEDGVAGVSELFEPSATEVVAAAEAPLLPPPPAGAPVVTASLEDDVILGVVTFADATVDPTAAEPVVTVGHEADDAAVESGPAWLTGAIEPIVE